MADRKTIDEVHKISDRRGNGQLRREVWVDERGQVVRYNLAFINHHLFQGDNGRVVGYDNQHGYLIATILAQWKRSSLKALKPSRRDLKPTGWL